MARQTQPISRASEVESFGNANGYQAAVGPFRTKFAADLFAEFGTGNPHMQTVDEVEAMAQKYLSLADDAIDAAENPDEQTANLAEFVWDVCSDTGQMFDNVKHMAWFRERVAYELFCDNQAEKVQEKKTVQCPNCGQPVWDVAFGHKLNKCWNCHLAFDNEVQS